MGEMLHRGGGEFGTAIDLSGDDFGEAFGPEVGLDGFVTENSEADYERNGEGGAEEGAESFGFCLCVDQLLDATP